MRSEYLLYGVLGIPNRSLGLLRERGTTLVDGSGVVRYTRRGILPTGAFSEAELREASR